MYDYLIVGCGLSGAVFAHLAKKDNKKVLIIDKRKVIAGNIYTETKNNIDIHKYGAHIFHTSNKDVWNFITSFGEFNSFINEPIANYKGKLYHLPFNMNTFNALWGVVTPKEAKEKIEIERQKANIKEIKNLEDQALSLVGKDIYTKLIKGYTEKQWGRDCKDLPSFIIKRLPLRFTYNNNYFDDLYQGIPIDGYTKIVENMIKGIDIRLGVDFLKDESLKDIAKKIVFTGEIDKFYSYQLGKLEYRTLKFETEKLDMESYQGNAVINYTEREIPYTRIIEHKFFNLRDSKVTYITKEYPKNFSSGDEPFYPINDERNTNLYNKYLELSKKDNNIIFAGRLGQYKYFDMDDVILNTFELYNKNK